jgi:hypothetical protein
MFQFLDITHQQRNDLDRWAESVINKWKITMSSEPSYLVWSNELYCQRGKDVWVDEYWWIEIAKPLFFKHKNDYDELGIAVIPALEILVHYHPEEYREYARYKIDHWYNVRGYHDPEYWWDLIIAVYPEHPVAELLFEEQENLIETGIAIRLGDRKSKINTRKNILSDLEEGDIYCVSQMLQQMQKSTLIEIFSPSELDQIKLAFLEIAKKDIPFDNFCINDQHSILRSTIIMDWSEILNSLSKNTNYLWKVLHLFEASSPIEILCWSLTNYHELIENLVFQLQSRNSSFNRIHHISFPSHAFALAIAWKRSQSRFNQ